MGRKESTSKVTEKKKEFARLLVEVKMSKADAYRKAYKRKDLSNDAANKAAYRLSKDDVVLRMIDELNKQLDKSAVLTRQQRMEWLSRVVTTPIGNVDSASDLCQEVSMDIRAVKQQITGRI